MFNEFKNLNYSSSTNKIRKLFEIYNRLRLPDLEERLLVIENRLKGRDIASENIKKSIPSPIFDKNCYVIFHAHNPEGKEIGGIIIDNTPTWYGNNQLRSSVELKIGNILIINSATDISEHNLPYLVPTGTYDVQYSFNGIIYNYGGVTFLPGTTTIIQVIIPRVDISLPMTFSDTDSNWPIYQWLDSFSDTYPSKAGRIRYTESVDGSLSHTFTFSISPTDYFVELSGEMPFYFPMYASFETYESEDANLPVSCDIEIQNFNFWFSQQKQIGWFPMIRARALPDTHANEFFDRRLGDITEYTYFAKQVSAKKHYIEIVFEHDILFNPIIKTGHLDGGYKFSSVPYDLNNTSF